MGQYSSVGRGDETASHGWRRGESQGMFMMVSGGVEDDSQVFGSAFQRDSKHRRKRRRGAGKLLHFVWNRSQADLFHMCVYRVALGWRSKLENVHQEQMDGGCNHRVW